MNRAGRWFGLLVALLAITVAAVVAARAVQPDEMLKDPLLEARARALSRDLRCMVCQNQSIDDSEAPLARDLRVLVRERLTEGDSDRQVMDFLTARYGPFVLLKPPLEWQTALLWFGPAAILVVAAAALLLTARRRKSPHQGPDGGGEDTRLSATEEAHLAELLAAADSPGPRPTS